MKSNPIDQQIAVKLSEELGIEKENQYAASMQKEIETYVESSPFTLADNPESKVIILKRTFGAEDITVSFSTDDFDNADDQHEDDSAYFDETDDLEASEAPESDKAPEPPAATPEELEDGEERPIDVEMEIVIKKKGKGSLRIDALAANGQIEISGFEYYSPEGEKQAASHTTFSGDVQPLPYVGPSFQTLDQTLQEMFEQYLETRGIDIKLAMFAPTYVEFKEQQHYSAWLSKLKDFIEAEL